MTENISKVLGSARYEAHWVQRSSLVRLIARGILPCSNYTAQLERRSERVEPPMWNLVFFAADICEKRLTYFEEQVTLVNNTGARHIIVHDACGEHQVPIVQHSEVETLDDMYIVYGKLPKPEQGHKGCILVPAESFVTATHYSAFGPAPREDCESFVQSHCAGPADTFSLASGEIPWPLIA